MVSKFSKFIVMVLVIATFVFTINTVSAASNASIEAENNLESAKNCIQEMISLDIRVNRVNETYQEAIILYEAQSSLERQRKKFDYKLVNEYALEVCNIKETAIKAQDELNIFQGKFESSKEDLDLTELEDDYQQIINSFEEERFEETIELIQNGYQSLSEVEASQTAFNLFYSTTTRTIKTFFLENWKKIITIIAIATVLIIVFWRTLKRLSIKMKLYNLTMKQKSVEELIKKMQYNYFKKKTMSETEFSVKLERYKDMIREIKRQIPSLKEKLIKIEEKKAEFKNPDSYKIKEKKRGKR